MNKKCVCLICYKLDKIWVDFLSTFTSYDVYIVVDDNSIKHTNKYNNIHIIQIDNGYCIKNGFINMSKLTLNKDVTAWDKAIYYFSSVNTVYDKVWFFEDDVFFYNEESLLSIDSKYNSDLLTNTYGENIHGTNNDWHWKKINIQFPPPYYCAMVCCVQMSSKLLFKIKDYATTNKTLFFLEALFSSICKKNNLQYDTPDELKYIVFRKDYVDTDITKHNLYHPVKNMNNHIHYRNIL
jgi:hypothetical protein